MGGLAAVVMNVVNFAVTRHDISKCEEFEAIKLNGVVEFSGRKRGFSGKKYRLLRIRTSVGLVQIDKGLDPYIASSMNAGDSIGLIGGGMVVTSSGKTYRLLRCRP